MADNPRLYQVKGLTICVVRKSRKIGGHFNKISKTLQATRGGWWGVGVSSQMKTNSSSSETFVITQAALSHISVLLIDFLRGRTVVGVGYGSRAPSSKSWPRYV